MVRPEEMINGEIYYVETMFEWIIRFKEIINDDIKGYSRLYFDGSDFNKSYLNSIYSHRIIRLATSIERDRLINEEINNGFKWINNVPRETIIEIY